MIGQPTLATTQRRIARYYLNKLRTVEAAYQHGHEHSVDALMLFDQEWSQIKRWRAWSAEHTNDHDDIAILCTEYPQAGSELFLIRFIHESELNGWRRVWRRHEGWATKKRK